MKERLLGILKVLFGHDADMEDTRRIVPENIGAWDSLAHLNLVVCLEDEFGVFFEPDEIADMLGGFDAIMAVLAKKGLVDR